MVKGKGDILVLGENNEIYTVHAETEGQWQEVKAMKTMILNDLERQLICNDQGKAFQVLLMLNVSLMLINNNKKEQLTSYVKSNRQFLKYFKTFPYSLGKLRHRT